MKTYQGNPSALEEASQRCGWLGLAGLIVAVVCLPLLLACAVGTLFLKLVK